MANASALVTGHAIGDTGMFGNTIYVGFKVPGANDSVMPFLEKNTSLREVDENLLVTRSRWVPHYQEDSPNALAPGINGPTSLAGIRNADDDLGRLRAALDELGVAKETDIVVVSDHGFSTMSKESATSPAAHVHYAGVPDGSLPSEFLAIDPAKDRGLKLFDPDRHGSPVSDGTVPRF
jgi:Type I phosphodiesterase / nucleotide pyrophosphatase